MAGLGANSPFYNWSILVAMLIGRFGLAGLAGLALLLAGRSAAQGARVVGAGSPPVDSLSFTILVLGAVIVLSALNFLPVIALGPLAEHQQIAGLSRS